MRQLLPLGSRAAPGTRGGGGRAFQWDLGLARGRRGPETLLEVPGRDPNSARGWERGLLEGSGGRTVCPPGRKVVPSHTEGRYRPEASASASGRRLDRRGREVSPQLLGWALRGSPGSIVRDRGGLGPSGCAPASPGTAASTQTACCWCVLVSIFCVRLCMTCSVCFSFHPRPLQHTRRFYICTLK